MKIDFQNSFCRIAIRFPGGIRKTENQIMENSLLSGQKVNHVFQLVCNQCFV